MKALVSYIPGLASAIVSFIVLKLIAGIGFGLVLQFLIFVVVYIALSIGVSRAMKSQ